MARKKSSDAVARTKVNQVVTKVSTFAALDERGAASFKKALTAKAEELGKTVAIYASYFWAVIQAKGGLVKENLAKILSGDVFAFA